MKTPTKKIIPYKFWQTSISHQIIIAVLFVGPLSKNNIIYTQECLDISGNQFSGTLPDGFYNLESLQGVYLSNNNFSGSIQSAIGGLIYLGKFQNCCFSREQRRVLKNAF